MRPSKCEAQVFGLDVRHIKCALCLSENLWIDRLSGGIIVLSVFREIISASAHAQDFFAKNLIESFQTHIRAVVRICPSS